VNIGKYGLGEIESCKLYYYILNMAAKVKTLCENYDPDDIDKMD